MSEISVTLAESSRISQVDFQNIPFGRIFSDHMFEIDYRDGTWHDARIIPYGNLQLSPALSSIHYGQAIFEGMKATKNNSGEVFLFRPEENWKRLNASARRMCMQELPEQIFMDALRLWLTIDAEWIPVNKGSALYIRPLMIATDDYLGVKSSESYKFLIYGCPVSSYYTERLKLRVEQAYVRAAAGGVGEAKAAGNYAASMYPASLAQKEGFHQLLWTDAFEHKYIEELGTSNFFAVVNGELYTPETDGTILKGITRDTVIKAARFLNIEVHETKLSIDFIASSFRSGKLTEAFATGTAATVAPIQLIQYKDLAIQLDEIEDSMAAKLLNFIHDAKEGRIPEFLHWRARVQPMNYQLS